MYAWRINFTSLLFMNVYRIYILLVWFDKKGEKFFWVYLCPFVDDLTKRWREIWSLYMHVYFIYMHVYFIFLFYTKRGRRILRIYICMFIFQLISEHICFVYAKRGEIFFIYAYMCYLVYAFIEYHYYLLLCMS